MQHLHQVRCHGEMLSSYWHFEWVAWKSINTVADPVEIIIIIIILFLVGVGGGGMEALKGHRVLWKI